jgi:hypothetical protein
VLDIEIPQEALKEICTPGDNWPAIALWFDRLKLARKMRTNDCRLMLKEYGYDKKEVSEKTSLEIKYHAFWLEAWNQHEKQPNNQ